MLENWLSFLMLPLPVQMRGILSTMGLLDVFDILLVAVIFYKIYEVLKDTRAVTIVKGLLVLLGLTFLTVWFQLHAVGWLMQKVFTVITVALPVVFQPELRRTLERLGQGHLFGRSAFLDEDEARSIINELEQTVYKLSETRTGALLVMERDMGLNDISDKGIKIDALISHELLLNIFIVNTPLHDGATIFRGKRIVSSACVLPLTEQTNLPTELGTRHRAAIGLSEQCDALIIVVSEETGIVSIAENGHLHRRIAPEQFRLWLQPLFLHESVSLKEIWENWRRRK